MEQTIKGPKPYQIPKFEKGKEIKYPTIGDLISSNIPKALEIVDVEAESTKNKDFLEMLEKIKFCITEFNKNDAAALDPNIDAFFKKMYIDLTLINSDLMISKLIIFLIQKQYTKNLDPSKLSIAMYNDIYNTLNDIIRLSYQSFAYSIIVSSTSIHKNEIKGLLKKILRAGKIPDEIAVKMSKIEREFCQKFFLLIQNAENISNDPEANPMQKFLSQVVLSKIYKDTGIPYIGTLDYQKAAPNINKSDLNLMSSNIDTEAFEVKEREILIAENCNIPVGTNNLCQCAWLYMYGHNSKKLFALHIDRDTKEELLTQELINAFTNKSEKIGTIIVTGNNREQLTSDNCNKILRSLTNFGNQRKGDIDIEKFSCFTKITPQAVVFYPEGKLIYSAHPGKIIDTPEIKDGIRSITIRLSGAIRVIEIDNEGKITLRHINPETLQEVNTKRVKEVIHNNLVLALSNGSYKNIFIELIKQNCIEEGDNILRGETAEDKENMRKYVTNRLTRIAKKYPNYETIINQIKQDPDYAKFLELAHQNIKSAVRPRKMLNRMIKVLVKGGLEVSLKTIELQSKKENSMKKESMQEEPMQEEKNKMETEIVIQGNSTSEQTKSKTQYTKKTKQKDGIKKKIRKAEINKNNACGFRMIEKNPSINKPQL